MRDLPIIMSAPMVRGLIREVEHPSTGKTQTRRLAWRTKINDGGHISDGGGGQMDYVEPHEVRVGPSPWQRVRPGDRLWVREAWATWMHAPALSVAIAGQLSRDPADWLYKADHPEWAAMEHDRKLLTEGNRKREDGKTGNYVVRPSIHMPRWASRFTLVVTKVRRQNLQSITSADAIAEGIAPAANSQTIDCDTPDPRDGFRDLWNSLHGADAWADNPEVVAMTFTVHRCNIDAMERAAA